MGDDMLDILSTKALTGLQTVDLDELGKRIDRTEPRKRESTDVDLPTLMLFTSGTTGRPKGALLSERNLFAYAINFTAIGAVDGKSGFLCEPPMFHILGLVTNIRPALYMGSTLVISPGFDPEGTLKRFADPKLGITHYFCVPQMAELIRNQPAFDPEKMRGLVALFTGGAPNPPGKIREWLADGIPVVNGYGMTEAGTIIGMPLERRLIEAKIESAGAPAPLVEIVAGHDDGSVAEPGEVGELMIRGPGVTDGYWRRPDANEESFTEDGWFKSGDLGYRDEDGFFFLVDRKKDMFISGGENVYPAEVEAALLAHPAISEAAVIGMPDEKWGEVGHAALVLRHGAAESEFDLAEHCGPRLARYKAPKYMTFLPELPRTGSGKLAKHELRALLARKARK